MEMYLDFPTHAKLCVPEFQMVGPHNMLPSSLTGSTPQPTASIGLLIGVVMAVVLICCFCSVVKTCFVITCCCIPGLFDFMV